MTIRPDHILPPRELNALPVAMLKLYCQVCGEQEEGVRRAIVPAGAVSEISYETKP